MKTESILRAPDTLHRKRRLALHLGLWAVVVFAQWWTWPAVVSDVKVLNNGVMQPITLPYTTNHGVSEHSTFTFEAVFSNNFRTPGRLHMMADDCVMSITINGNTFHQSACRPCETCTTASFNVPDLPHGDLPMKITVKDFGGTGSLFVREAFGVTGFQLLVVALGGWAILALFLLRQRSMLYGWMAAFSVVVALNYYLETDPDARQHDLGGHKEYVDHIINNASLPRVQQGWETWQPPVFYVLDAGYVKASSVLDIPDRFRRAQHPAAFLYVLTMVLLAFHWHRLGFQKHTAWLGLALMLFMPAHVFTSARISNDALMPLYGALAFLAAWSYARNPTLRTAALTGGLLMVSLATKTSTLSLAAGCGLTLLWKDHVDGRSLSQRAVRALLLGVPPLLWLMVWFWRNHDQTGEWMYVNGSLQDTLRIPNKAFKYLWFDIPAFLSESQFATYSGHMRDSVPTSLAASALTGEFDLSWIPTAVQTFLRAAMLPMIALFFYGVFQRPEGWRVRPWVPAVLLFGFHAFFMVSYAWKYPFACNQDARLWGPAYAPAAVVVTWGWEVALERLRGPWLRAAQVAPVVFLGTLLLFWQKFMFG